IDELEHIMANLIQVNKDMEERLDKQGVRLYRLEQLDIPQQVSKAVRPFGSSGAPGASGSSQLLPPPPPPSSTNQESPSKGATAPISSKTAALAKYQAWTTTDIRL
nr:hypothetical protein [Tanacetum cinerariifolium]